MTFITAFVSVTSKKLLKNLHMIGIATHFSFRYTFTFIFIVRV